MQATWINKEHPKPLGDFEVIQKEILQFYEENTSTESIDFKFVKNFVNT